MHFFAKKIPKNLVIPKKSVFYTNIRECYEKKKTDDYISSHPFGVCLLHTSPTTNLFILVVKFKFNLDGSSCFSKTRLVCETHHITYVFLFFNIFSFLLLCISGILYL